MSVIAYVRNNLFILLLSVFFLGCGKVPSNTPIVSYQTLSSEQVKTLISNAAPDEVFLNWSQITLTDQNYILPTEQWVRTIFSESFQTFLFNYNVKDAQLGRNDCDNFALYARTIANVLNRHNPNAKSGLGIAFGEAIGFSNIETHAINFVVVADKNKKAKIIFYEPQTGEIIDITNAIPIFYWRM